LTLAKGDTIIYIEAKSMSTSVSSRLLSSAALAVFAVASCSAQNIAPAHSGTVHYFEGDVTVDGVKLVSQVARFTEMKEQSELHTGLGRAEILLTPGVLLRVGENSSVKMLDNRLVSTRVEFLSGIAMVEAVDAGSTVKDPPVTIIYKDFQAQTVHFGVFELTSLPGQVRVFKGEAKVLGNGTSVTVKEGNAVDLTTTMAMAKFDAKDGDDLYLWSRDRSAYLSAGNMSSARTLANSGYGNAMGYSNMGYSSVGLGGMGMGYGGLGFGSGYAYTGWNPAMWNGFSGGWYYNSYLNMYSYMPFAGTMYSPFGYGYYNPNTIGYVYTPGYYWTGAGGSRTGTTTGVPLATLPTTGTLKSGSAPLLPRLGVTASLHPSLASPAPGTQPGSPTASLSARNGFAAPGSPSSNVRAAAPAAAAPAAAAPARAAAPAGRR
jgi:hypothetical protein